MTVDVSFATPSPPSLLCSATNAVRSEGPDSYSVFHPHRGSDTLVSWTMLSPKTFDNDVVVRKDEYSDSRYPHDGSGLVRSSAYFGSEDSTKTRLRVCVESHR